MRPEGGEQDAYQYVDRLLEDSRPGCGGLLFLPYLAGERFPVVDGKVRGCYIGVDMWNQSRICPAPAWRG